jgi:serine/threonine protein kinase
MPPVFPRNAAALLIGIGQYDRADGITALPFAARDARSLAKVLTDPDVCGFPRERIALLTDAKASRSAIDRHLSRWLPSQARGAELVFLYFAGHGVVHSVDGREEGYLVPSDADPGDIARHGIAMSDVAKWIDALQADAVVVCLDCCHAGGILPRDGVTLRGDRDMAIRPSVIQRLGGRGRFLIASCDRGQKSIESEEFRHGLFTYHLLRGLGGAGDRDGDGYVSIVELFNYVASSVSEDARTRYHREQTPWTSATYNGDVLLSAVRQKPKTVPPSTRESAAPEPTTTEDADLLARLRRDRKHPNLTELPFIFRNLAHRSEEVRKQAHRALSACPWEQVCRTTAEMAQAGADPIGDILDGLAALETHVRVIALLDTLATILQGPMRDRAVWLLDRKRLAADRDRVAEVFRRSHGGEILRVLGPGTYTGAYLARLDGTGLEVVVRVLRPEFAAQPMVRAHFIELGVKAVRLVHHNLVLTRDARAFADSGLYFTVRDYVEGATLREVLASGRRFDPMQSCKILRQILEALTPLHRDGLMHGGIKPSNVFLTRDDRVVLGEPSLPIPASGYDLPRLAYDFRYAPPELFRGPNQASPASDFYALGCVAHELFRGAPPFVSDNHYELIARHDRDPIPAVRDTFARAVIDGWLQTALAKAAASRFADLEAARAALNRLESDLREPPVEGRARRAPDSMAEMASGIISDPPSSVHLMREQSLMELAGRESLVPLTGDPGHTFDPAATGGVSPAMSPSARIDIPGYRFVKELGRGGMGVVFEAIQESLERPVAIKIISHSYASEESRRRFLTEARALAAVPHPNIVAVYDFGDRDGAPYLVMEYCPGGSLSQRLGGTPMNPRTATALMSQIATGVAAAHAAGILHRDLKPGNILFSADGTPKITDFGLARLTERTTHDTLAGAVMGTPSYMSPEQAQGHADLGPTTDVYSLGATLYECLTGRPPFRSESVIDTLMKVMSEDPVPPRQLVPNVSRDLEAICLRCLQKDPARRYAGAEELAADLERFDAEPTRAKRRWWPFG